MNKEMTINGVQYTYEENANGEGVLMRYNKQYKMWVKLRFSASSLPNSILETLKEQYIEHLAHVS